MNTIEEILLTIDEIRPTLQQEGGDIEVVRFDDATGSLEVRLQGMCSACAMSAVTLKTGVERVLRSRVPKVREVTQVE
ncbi:MAG: NifU family protein [Actinobacteria bacterium]|nr:NifU family protein [Actinomycetota bacterium]MQB00179.1 NifU family protein [Actinomycetota bacterium]